jgi:hypothetical protein
MKIGFHTSHKDIRKFVCAVYAFMLCVAMDAQKEEKEEKERVEEEKEDMRELRRRMAALELRAAPAVLTDEEVGAALALRWQAKYDELKHWTVCVAQGCFQVCFSSVHCVV